MIRRPKPGENEDDILKMQEEFLKDNNITPSAQIVNLRTTEHNTTKRNNCAKSDTKKASKYAISRGLGAVKRPRTATQSDGVIGDIIEKNCLEKQKQSNKEGEDDKVYFPVILPSILGDIVEKNVENIQDFQPITMSSKRFPMTTIYTPSEKQTNAMEVDVGAAKASAAHKVPDLSSQNSLLNATEAKPIHDESVSLLSKMTKEEILEEQANLLTKLNPNLVEFIKHRQKNKLVSGEEISKNSTSYMEKMETEQLSKTNTDDSLWENDVLSHPQVNSWLHFDNLEKDKLEWIKGIEESQIEKPDEPYEARFDFSGYLLPYTIQYTEKTKTLFHHGKESHRPGYSVPELFELTRSSVVQQRVIALNTLAGIIEHNSTGIYGEVIDIPLTKIFFVIRIALDDNKVNILEPSLKALRNMIYNRVDEACLDALVGFEEGMSQPSLENDRSEVREMEAHESELKDFHLAEIDLIAALVRTDILQRLYYIIENLRPNLSCVQYALQILIRLARDSVDTCSRIVQMDHLMNSVIKSFLPSTSINFMFTPDIVYNKPVLAALKLMKIISLQSKEIGQILIRKYDILTPLSAYVSSGLDGMYGLRLQIEAFCIFTNLLNYELGIENAIAVSPMVITALFKHVQGTDVFITTSILSATHAAVVLQFINKLLVYTNVSNFKEQIYPLLREGLQKWLSQVSNSNDYTCGHLRLVCSLLDCCITMIQVENVQIQFLDVLLINLCNSNGFKLNINNLVSSSNLLSDIEDKDLYTIKNIMSLRTVLSTSTRRILPVLQMNSPIPFLLTLFKLLQYVHNRDISFMFINQVNSYMNLLTKKQLCLTSNWFSRVEVELVYYIIRLSATVDTSETCKDVIYTAASKLCYILRVDKKCELQFLFENIIFKKQWFTAQRLFNLVSLSEADGFTKALTNIEDIRHCYSSVMKLKHIHSRNIVLRDWQEPILPRDWIYLPIVSLYSDSQEVKPSPTAQAENADDGTLQIAKEKELVIRCCLEWIIFNEMCFPDLLSDIDVTDRFCRVMCVFLCDNSIFLDRNIKVLLNKCTQIIFKYKEKLNFDKDLVGLHNFQDLYTQFLEQFQSVSYGDCTFACCVLVPIAQEHNPKWRKLLWSEYAGCLRALDCPEEMMCYSLNEYMYPEETDESLIKCYYRALSSSLVRPGTVAYKIAHHHVQKYKQTKCT